MTSDPNNHSDQGQPEREEVTLGSLVDQPPEHPLAEPPEPAQPARGDSNWRIAMISTVVLATVTIGMIVAIGAMLIKGCDARKSAPQAIASVYNWKRTTDNAFLPYEARSADQLLVLYDDDVETRARFAKYFASRGWETNSQAVRGRLAKLAKQELGKSGRYRVYGWKSGLISSRQRLAKQQTVLSDSAGLILKLPCGNPIEPIQARIKSAPPLKPVPRPAPLAPEPPAKVVPTPSVTDEPVSLAPPSRFIRTASAAEVHRETFIQPQAGSVLYGQSSGGMVFYHKSKPDIVGATPTCDPSGQPPVDPPTDWCY